ncbi:MAG: 1,4-alpha-glucan branching enzyme, partial [Chloroflexota bacterium]
MTKYPTLPEGALNAIVYGYHGDPFSVLGPHELEDGLVIRAFVPGVKAIRLLWAHASSADAAPEAFSRIHDAGFFEIIVSQRSLPVSYQLELQYGNDHTQIIDDPYNFPPQITDFDEHLMAEG